MREPLLLPLAALATGIIATRVAGFEVRELVPVLGALLLLTAVAAWKRLPVLIVCGGIAVVCAGAIVAALHRPDWTPVIEAGLRETVVVEGCVVEPPELAPGRQRFVAELDPKARAQVSVYFDDEESPLDLEYGDRLDIVGRIRPPRNFGNPGAFDYENYLVRKDIHWTISVTSPDDLTVLPGSCGSLFWSVIHRIRGSALDRLESLFPGQARRLAMLRAILLGESSQLEAVWKESFRRTGTYHTLVISGLHLTVLAGFLHLLLRLVALPLGWRLTLTTLAAWLYVFVTGCDTPVVRAAGGLTLFFAATWFFRRRRLLNILAAVAIVFLVADPSQLFDASFHLSFLAVAVIGALAIPLLEGEPFCHARATRGLADADRDLRLPPRSAQLRVELRLLAETQACWLPVPRRWLLTAVGMASRLLYRGIELTVVSGLIQVGLALPMAVYFHRVSFTGLVANPIVVPLMSLAVPSGFLGILLNWEAPATLAGWLVDASLSIVTAMAGWEAALRLPPPPGWLGALFLLSLLLAAAGLRRDGRWRTVALALPGAVLAVILVHPFHPRLVPDSLELTAVDVGQAESLFVSFPNGDTMLVDGGGFPSIRGRKPEIDPGEDIVAPYLWSRSIRRLGVVASSHGHTDHIAGLFAIVENFRPREVWTSAAASDPATDALRSLASEHGATVRSLAAGDSFSMGGTTVRVLAPLEQELAGTIADNNDSLVLRFEFGRHAFLLTGDIETRVESALSPSIEAADVLKVAHHGSRTSSTPPFVDALAPAVAIVSAGWVNPFHFPHPEILDELAEHHTTVLQTNRDGLVTVRSDGKRLRVDTYR